MLDTPIFPTPGSMAQWQGRPVRIHQWNNDGSALIFGEGFTRRCEPEELTPPPAGDLFEKWRDARVIAVGRDHFTPMEDVYADYLEYCRSLGDSDFTIQTRLAFGRRAVASGISGGRGYTRQPYSSITRLSYGLNLTLRPPGEGEEVPPAPQPKRIKRSRARKVATA